MKRQRTLSRSKIRVTRGEPVIARILGATIEQLALVGLEGLTLERVAARAAVNRTTIYRRWPIKEDLVLAALRWMGQVDVLADTGELRGDLDRFVERATARLFAPGTLGLIRTVLGAPANSPLRRFATCTHELQRRSVLELFDRAQLRGEIRADIDKELFLDSIFGMLFVRLVFRREQPTEKLRARIVDELIRLAAPRSAAAPVRPKQPRAPSRRKRRATGAGSAR